MKSEKRHLDSQKYHIKVLRKALDVLELFSEEVSELTAAEISKLLNQNKTSAFRIISNLEAAGYLEKDPATLKYRLGMKLFFLGSLVRPYSQLKRMAKPFLTELNQQCGETVHLTVLHKGEVLYLDKLEGHYTIRVVISRIGESLPAHCSGVGKMLLSSLPEKEVAELVASRGLPKFTPKTITTLNDLKRELALTRERGFAIDNEEVEAGIKCVAAPIHFNGAVIAAISASAPKERFERNREELISLVMDQARQISDSLGEVNLKRRRAD